MRDTVTAVWPALVQVVTPTVPARRGLRDVTLDQWRTLGADPIVVEQPEHIPYGRDGTTATATRAVREGLATGAEWILHAEDDIDIDPRLLDAWPVLLRDEQPVALWHRPRFAPPGLCERAVEVSVVRARSQSSWWGSQAVLLPRRLAVEAVETAPLPGVGWDVHLRRVWAERGRRLHLAVPCLVEHRRLPRIATRWGHVGSCCYRGPRTDE